VRAPYAARTGRVFCTAICSYGAKESPFMTSQPTPTKAAQAPGEPGGGLQAGLKNRHLSMIAIGGVIGAGLFVGSSSGIATASAEACPGISSSGTTRTPRSVAYFTISRICC